jgi:hypothetical protein
MKSPPPAAENVLPNSLNAAFDPSTNANPPGKQSGQQDADEPMTTWGIAVQPSPLITSAYCRKGLIFHDLSRNP